MVNWNNDFSKAGKITISVATLIGTTITIITFSFKNIHPAIGLSIVAIVLAVTLVVLYFIPKNSIPEGVDEIAEEIENPNSKRPFKVVFPCDNNYYEAANNLAREKFGKNSVTSKRVADWKKRNDLLLTCLTDENRMVGYFDILPLESSFAIRLINGQASEKEIRAENILAVHQMKKAEYVYFAGVAVMNTHTISGCFYANYLFHSALLYLYFFYGESALKQIITIPTSPSGLKMAQKWGFTLERENSFRKDGFDLYTRDFRKVEIADIIKQKKRLYKRFDFSAYLKAFQDINGQLGHLPM